MPLRLHPLGGRRLYRPVRRAGHWPGADAATWDSTCHTQVTADYAADARCYGRLGQDVAYEALWNSAMRREERQAQAVVLRDLVGNPFRPAPAVDPAWLAWQGGVVRELARAAYEERRLPEGTHDPARLAVLADALEDAGCADADLLGHLRGPGPHVRGCHALDLLLGKG